MKKLVMMAVISLMASGARASELLDIKTSDIDAVKTNIAVPVPQAPGISGAYVTGEISKLHLLAQTGNSLLFTHADNEALFGEFNAMWEPILWKFGLTPTFTEYNNRLGMLNYDSPDGRVVRSFMAEGLNYDALKPEEIAKVRNQLISALERKGMTPVASFSIRHDAFRPTFNIYYLTAQGATQDGEVQLRQLKNSFITDFDILEKAGIEVVRKDSPYSIVYIGKNLGFAARAGKTEEEANKELADYKKMLAERNKEFIGARVSKLEQPYVVGTAIYSYVVNIYFYQ